MVKGAGPTSEKLLELLQRAANELKHVQGQASTAIAALQKEQAAHQQTEQELEAARKALGDLGTQQGAATLAGLEAANAECEVLRATVAELEAQVARDTATREGVEEAHRQALADTTRQADDIAARLAAAEAAMASEKEKHSQTAQKLLESRSKVLDLEKSLSHEQERVNGLEISAAQLSDQMRAAADAAVAQHAEELERSGQIHATSLGALQTQLNATQAELARATDTWHQVERQYEALHREMLQVLEQRDEARRQLDSERAERDRALQPR